MKPRVLFLHQNAVVGGAELHLVDVAQYFRESSTVVLFADGPLRGMLERAGVEVRVAATAWAQEGVRGGVPRPTVRGAFAVLRLSAAIAREARKHDIIYANSPKALTIAAVAGVLARRPVLWAFHDLLDPAHFSRAAIRQMATIANRGADRVIACSAASAESLIHYGGSRDRIHVVHNGLDPVVPAESTGALEELRRELNPSGDPLSGVFGRVTQWKGQHIAIELLGRVPGMRLLIVGDAEEAGYIEALQRRAAELGAADRVSCLGRRSDVADLMRLVDIVLHTSVAPEPFGRVIVEAMLAGRPVIASNGGGVPEIIEDGVSGLLVPPGDVEVLAAAVSSLLQNPQRAHMLAAVGCERARANFTLNAMLQSIGRHVEEVAR